MLAMDNMIAAHAQGFLCEGSWDSFAPRELFMASSENPQDARGFLISLTYWDFDETDDAINERMVRKRHGLLYNKDDWTGVHYESLNNRVLELYNEFNFDNIPVAFNSQQQKDFSTSMGQEFKHIRPIQYELESRWDDARVEPHPEKHHVPGSPSIWCSKEIVATYAQYIRYWGGQVVKKKNF